MNQARQDQLIKCANCGQQFAWTAGEQEFYASKGLPQPQYCLICRGIMQARKKDPGARAKQRKDDR